MTNQTFPIIPPTKLVELWRAEASNIPATYSTDLGGRRDYIDFIATAAAQWGWEQRGAATEAELQQRADQELEACCEQLRKDAWYTAVQDLRAARRPTPKLSSFKKQAYDALDTYIYGEPDPKDKERTYNTIRRALEALPND